jgi:ParB-like chromosome segregation protein Spo0J
MELRDMGERGPALIYFPPDRLEVKAGLNARDFTRPEIKAHVAAIAASIIANGFYIDKPIAIFRHKEKIDNAEIVHAYIADGECRWRAAMLAVETLKEQGKALDAERLKVACVQLPSHMNDVDLILHRNLSNTGERFTPLEEGKNVQHALQCGAKLSEIAAKLGKTEAYLKDILENLVGAPQAVQNMVSEGEVSATLAAETVREEGKEAAAEILKAAAAVAKEQAVKKGKDPKKAKATKKHVRQVKPPTPRARKEGPEKKPDYLVVAYAGVQGEYKVTFGEKIVIMTWAQWHDALRKIAAEIGWPEVEVTQAAE